MTCYFHTVLFIGRPGSAARPTPVTGHDKGSAHLWSSVSCSGDDGQATETDQTKKHFCAMGVSFTLLIKMNFYYMMFSGKAASSFHGEGSDFFETSNPQNLGTRQC